MNYAIDEVSSCVVTFIYGAYMLYNPEVMTPGVWEMLMLPSYIVEVSYIAFNRKSFTPRFFKFIIIHHLITVTSILFFLLVETRGNLRIIQHVPYVLIWNVSTIPWFIDYCWDLHWKPNYSVKLGYIIIQRIWRTSLWFLMLFNGMEQPDGLIMFSIGAATFEIYDVPHQIKGLLKIM